MEGSEGIIVIERLFVFLRRVFAERFFGVVTSSFESGKVTPVKVRTKRSFEYAALLTGERE